MWSLLAGEGPWRTISQAMNSPASPGSASPVVLLLQGLLLCSIWCMLYVPYLSLLMGAAAATEDWKQMGL